MTLHRADSFEFISKLPDSDRPDVIYLDPMYPPKDKVKSLPKKDMMIARFAFLLFQERHALTRAASNDIILVVSFFSPNHLQSPLGNSSPRRGHGLPRPSSG